MPENCPYCRTGIPENASTCPACGAWRGVWGRRAERWCGTANILLALAATLFAMGLASGVFVAARCTGNWFDGLLVFLLFTPFMALLGGMGLAIRHLIPRMRESWFR